MYDWLRNNYADTLARELEEQIENEEITEEEASILFNIQMENWDTGYGDYMYDFVNER